MSFTDDAAARIAATTEALRDAFDRGAQAEQLLMMAALRAAPPLPPTDAQIDAAVDRFLAWRLPDDFTPDGGVSFIKPGNRMSWPIGTNLLTATQAKAMLVHIFRQP
jgi:hypothetical protein